MVPDRSSSRPTTTLIESLRVGATARLAVAAVLVLASLASCARGEQSSEAGQQVSRAASATERVSLAGVCPARIVIQTAWTPESTHGGLFQMLGRGFTIDATKKRVVGKLVARGGVDTGVELELRAGGPAVGQQPIVSLLKQDPTITMAQNALEDGIGGSSELRTTAVFSPYAVDPVVFMWDKTRHPDFTVLQDIGQTDAKVVTFQTAQIDYLLGAGVFRPTQIDYSFNGSPERLATDRSVVVGGFITNDPWTYAKLGIEVDSAFVSDTGYPNYRNQLVIRTADKDKLDGCLRRLVPVMQEAMVDYITQPQAAMKAVASTAAAYKLLPYSYEQAMWGAVTANCRGLLTDRPPRQVFGETDPNRVKRLIDILRPIYAGGSPAGQQAGRRAPLPDDLSAEELATNEYLDPAVKPDLTTLSEKGCPKP